ncbi:hypothetical protein G5V59_12990 [Nocardioides sp. W3-2-3]|uniref:hypothetical protein n=1 Tax=Nocardioides convexus TaxID=2712224 RepID=UPI0024187A4B|nr:hypothetical protein [Nocardioides convexus]NHA00630.1 hypothetical protein [Nocardioides convexus]
MQDVGSHRAEGVGVQALDDAEHDLSREVGFLKRAATKRLQADDLIRQWVQDDHVIAPMLRDPSQDVADEIGFRVNDDDAMAGLDVLQSQVGEQGGLSGAGWPNDVAVPEGVDGLGSDWPLGCGSVAEHSPGLRDPR